MSSSHIYWVNEWTVSQVLLHINIRGVRRRNTHTHNLCHLWLILKSLIPKKKCPIKIYYELHLKNLNNSVLRCYCFLRMILRLSYSCVLADFFCHFFNSWHLLTNSLNMLAKWVFKWWLQLNVKTWEKTKKIDKVRKVYNSSVNNWNKQKLHI